MAEAPSSDSDEGEGVLCARQGHGWCCKERLDGVDGSLTQVPDLKLDILVSDRFNVEADGWGAGMGERSQSFGGRWHSGRWCHNRGKRAKKLWGFHIGVGGGVGPGAKREAGSH